MAASEAIGLAGIRSAEDPGERGEDLNASTSSARRGEDRKDSAVSEGTFHLRDDWVRAGRANTFGTHAGVPCSHLSSVIARCPDPSAFITNSSAYGCGAPSYKGASSRKPKRALLNIIVWLSGDHAQCASLP